LTYEGVLFAITPPSNVKDFALHIVAYIFWVNAIAFVGLILIMTAASAPGLAFPKGEDRNRRAILDE
jgi:hypothetical protein